MFAVCTSGTPRRGWYGSRTSASRAARPTRPILKRENTSARLWLFTSNGARNNGVGSLFSAASGPSARLHPESCGHPEHPGVLTERATPLHPQAQRLQLRHRLWPVDQRHPISSPPHRPVAQPRRHRLPHRQPFARLTNFARNTLCAPRTSRRAESARPSGRNGSTSSLLERPGTRGLPMGMPAFGSAWYGAP